MILALLLKFIKSKLDAEMAKQTPIGGEVIARKVASGLRLFGGRWELDCILRRTQ